MDRQLHRAAELGNWDVIRQFEHQLNTQQTPNKDTVLHVLSQFCDSSYAVQQILQRKPELLLKFNAQKETLLHIAARKGHSNVVQAVIDRIKLQKKFRSRVLRSENVYGNLALHEAIKNNRHAITRMLVEENPNLTNIPNRAKESPLYLAVKKGDESVVALILSTPKLFPEDSWSQVIDRFFGPWSRDSEGAKAKRIRLRDDSFYIGPDNKTALHAAAIRNFPECLKLILRQLPHLTKRIDAFGWTALHYAARLNHQEVARLLLAAEGYPGYVQTSRKTAVLHVAVTWGHIQVIEELLNYCPDCWNMVTRTGKNAIHLAVENEQQEVLDFILRKPWASQLINSKDANGNTPLHLYVATKKLLGRELVSYPEVERDALNEDGLTPLDLIGDAANQDKEKRDFLRSELEKVGATQGCRKIVSIQEDSGKPTGQSEEERNRMTETYLVVATLLITICFASAFTIPGGYESNGQPVFLKKAAFIVFIVSDVSAMIWSLEVLLTLLLSYDMPSEEQLKVLNLTRIFISQALLALMVSFLTGLYVTLPILGIRIFLFFFITPSGLLFFLYYCRNYQDFFAFVHSPLWRMVMQS